MNEKPEITNSKISFSFFPLTIQKGERLNNVLEIAKRHCVKKICEVLKGIIQPALANAEENAIADYVNLNLPFWAVWRDEQSLKKQCEERFKCLASPGSVSVMEGIQNFLNDSQHSVVKLNSLKYLFVAHFFKVRATTDEEASLLVMKLADALDFYPVNHGFGFDTDFDSLSHPVVLSVILQYNPELAAAVLESLNALYPACSMGNLIVNNLLNDIPDDLRQNLSYNEEGLFAFVNIYHFLSDKLSVVLCDSPMQNNLQKLHDFLSSAQEYPVHLDSMAYQVVAGILGQGVATDEEAALLVQRYCTALGNKLRPQHHKAMLFGLFAEAQGMPQDISRVVGKILHSFPVTQAEIEKDIANDVILLNRPH